jgi:hypothetical protein
MLTPMLLGLCLTGPGCSFVHHIKRNLINEPQFGCDEVAIRMRHERLARQAWDEMARQYGKCFSVDYRRGFIDGFADYLTYGGCQNGCDEAPIVPAVPPEHYRHKKYMTPEGYRAIEEWFMGFRHGSSTAVASGLRQLVVIPVLNPPVFLRDTYATEHQHAAAQPEEVPQMPPSDSDLLPPPRTAPPGGAAGGVTPPLPTPPPVGGDAGVGMIPAGRTVPTTRPPR